MNKKIDLLYYSNALQERYLHKPVGIAEIKLSKILSKELVGKFHDSKDLQNEILHTLDNLNVLQKGNGE